ncbi:MAG: DUF86 domain-containing protein [Candidatus Liptonbacteria bacterium]|nr:DUF86 domain-containing protein [Candidatus Liptonbacteria bacterium]
MLEKKFVEKKLEEISRYLGELAPILKLSYKEFNGSYKDMRAAERDFQLIVDAAVDINTHIVLALNLPPPEKNYDSFIMLGRARVFSEKEAKALAPSAGLRNRLVHEYDEIDPEILYRSLKTFAKRYRDYGRAVLRYLEKK